MKGAAFLLRMRLSPSDLDKKHLTDCRCQRDDGLDVPTVNFNARKYNLRVLCLWLYCTISVVRLSLVVNILFTVGEIHINRIPVNFLNDSYLTSSSATDSEWVVG